MRIASRVTVACVAASIAVGCGAGTDSDRAADRRVVEVTVEGGGGGSKSGADARRTRDVPGVDRCDGARSQTTSDNLREAEIAIRCLTNAAREDRGLEPLSFDEKLARAAATRSDDMGSLNYFAHQGPDGGNVQRAVRRTGWVPDATSWWLGENIGWAPTPRATPADLMRSWLASPTHRANILSEHFEEMGVGAVATVPDDAAGDGATYTQVFGATGRAARQAQTTGS